MRLKGCNTPSKGRQCLLVWWLMMLSGCSTLPMHCKNYHFSLAATITVGMCSHKHKFWRDADMTATSGVLTSGKIQFKGFLPQKWPPSTEEKLTQNSTRCQFHRAGLFPAEEFSLQAVSNCHIIMQQSMADIYNPSSINFILFQFWLRFTIELWSML